MMNNGAFDRSALGSGELRHSGNGSQDPADTNYINHEAFTYYQRLRLLKKYIEGHPDEPISLGKAARITATEKTYFSSFFRRKVGITFTDWIRRFRVARAMKIMKDRDSSITEIAYEVGFSDLRTFERAFKRLTRKTPREYRRAVQPHCRAAETARAGSESTQGLP